MSSSLPPGGWIYSLLSLPSPFSHARYLRLSVLRFCGLYSGRPATTGPTMNPWSIAGPTEYDKMSKKQLIVQLQGTSGTVRTTQSPLQRQYRSAPYAKHGGNASSHPVGTGAITNKFSSHTDWNCLGCGLAHNNPKARKCRQRGQQRAGLPPAAAAVTGKRPIDAPIV